MYRRFLVLLLVAGLFALPSLCGTSVAQDEVKEKAAKQKDTAKEEEPKEIREPDVIFVPTPRDVVAKMLELADVKKGDVVYDLGCGDGRLVIAACKRFGARGLGVDLDPRLIARAQAEAQWQGVADRARFEDRNIFDVDLTPATVVLLYLSVEMNQKLRPRLLAELSPGSRIVSNRFDMGGAWAPDRTVHAGDTPVHLWRIGPRAG